MNREDVKILTAPGRTEICGNHTDHQHGIVLAAAVDLETKAVVTKNDSDRINISSQGFGFFSLNVNDTSIRPDEYGTPQSLVRGVLSGFKAIGCRVGGFDALISSGILPGSGLSSSAAFEVIVGRILNTLYNGNEVNDINIARIGQMAENFWYGKPSGLMDQTASAVGGLLGIDFKSPSRPVVEMLKNSFESSNHEIVIVNTGSSHRGLTEAYAAIPEDMSAVAKCFGKEFLRDVDQVEFFSSIDRVGQKTGSIATYRAVHFFLEQTRVREAISALKCDDFPLFLEMINQSGRSSQELLKNISVPDSDDPGLAPALELSRSILSGCGATRPHGGGFAGTIQAIVPAVMVPEYTRQMERVYGPGSTKVLKIK